MSIYTKKLFRKFLISVLIVSWVFSGFPYPYFDRGTGTISVEQNINTAFATITASSTTYSTVGTFTYIVSTNACTQNFSLWGAGGGGADGTTSGGGGGGGGGAFASSTTAFDEDSSHTLVVGQGGIVGSSDGNGGDGADTTVDNPLIVADSGKGGLSPATGGAGGLIAGSASIGDVEVIGGNGGNGVGGGDKGGGGGGAGGFEGNGGAGSGQNSGAGAGGSGGASVGTGLTGNSNVLGASGGGGGANGGTGGDGGAPGGGGGGGEIPSTGAGGNGQIIITEYIDSGGCGPAVINVSGTLYSDEGNTTIGSKTINMAVATSTVGVYSTTADGSGNYTFSNVDTAKFGVGTPFFVWVDDGTTTYGATLTKASSTVTGANITGLDIYQNRLILRHEAESATTTTNADLSFYDYNSDNQLQFTSVAGGTLELFAGQELHLFASSTMGDGLSTHFAPGGPVTLHGGSGNDIDGDLHLGSAASTTSSVGTTTVMTLGGTLTIAGSLYASSSDLSFASYDGVSTSTDSSGENDNNPRDITFKPNGAKMYAIGTDNDSVYQYTLSTPWDLTTSSYDSVSTSTNSSGEGESTPVDVTFKPDGTKMYMAGWDTTLVFQYTLSTAWDVSSASYDSVSTSTNSSGESESSIRGIEFKPDGLKMYMVGNGSDAVHQYTLSTAWDISTASYDSVSKSVKSEGEGETNPSSVAFTSDGTKMFVLGWTTMAVHQYTLSTPWDLTTSSYDNVLKNVNTSGESMTSPRGLALKSDGTKMYVQGDPQIIYQYTLSPTLNSEGFGVFFNASTTEQSIYTPNVLTGFASTTFNGSGGGWTFQGPAIVAGDFTISAGTVTAPATELYLAGDYENAGTFTSNSGTIFFGGSGARTLSGTITGDSAFNDIIFTDSSESNGTAVNIDNASDFGVMASSTRQVVRTSTGILYAVVNDGGSCEVWKSANGTSWAEQDSSNNPACLNIGAIVVAIDSADILHIFYANAGTSLNYITFDTQDGGAADDAFNTAADLGGDTESYLNGGRPYGIGIAIDNNNIPHVVFTEPFVAGSTNVEYRNRIGGGWNADVIAENLLGIADDVPFINITISEDNIPEIAYMDRNLSDLTFKL